MSPRGVVCFVAVAAVVAVAAIANAAASELGEWCNLSVVKHTIAR
jgi:hypothetical protein